MPERPPPDGAPSDASIPEGPLSEGQFGAVLAAIDEVNAADPNQLEVDGEVGPKEFVHARLMTKWVLRLDPGADQAQLVAARAHHLRRWAWPRSDYPEGRAGYLRWRAAAKRRHADEVGAILADRGAPPAFVERVQGIVRKEGLAPGGREPCEPAVQVHEDALCLVFLETQLDAVAARLGPAKATEVLRRTLAKMSPQGLAQARGLTLSEGGRGALGAAMGRDAGD